MDERQWVRQTIAIKVQDVQKEKQPNTNANANANSNIVTLAGELNYVNSSSVISKEASRVRVGAILLHPHPALGGNVNNNVLYALRDQLCRMDVHLVALMNMRGVGGSTGSINLWGSKDAEDIIHVCEYFLEEWSDDDKEENMTETEIETDRRQQRGVCNKLLLCGYSWG